MHLYVFMCVHSESQGLEPICIALGENNTIWALDTSGNLWFRTGVTAKNPQGEDDHWWQVHICNMHMHNTSSSTVGQMFCLYAVCLTPLLSKNHTFCVKMLIIPKACCCFLAEMFQICQNNDHLFCLFFHLGEHHRLCGV